MIPATIYEYENFITILARTNFMKNILNFTVFFFTSLLDTMLKLSKSYRYAALTRNINRQVTSS